MQPPRCTSSWAKSAKYGSFNPSENLLRLRTSSLQKPTRTILMHQLAVLRFDHSEWRMPRAKPLAGSNLCPEGPNERRRTSQEPTNDPSRPERDRKKGERRSRAKPASANLVGGRGLAWNTHPGMGKFDSQTVILFDGVIHVFLCSAKCSRGGIYSCIDLYNHPNEYNYATHGNARGAKSVPPTYGRREFVSLRNPGPRDSELVSIN